MVSSSYTAPRRLHRCGDSARINQRWTTRNCLVHCGITTTTIWSQRSCFFCSFMSTLIIINVLVECGGVLLLSVRWTFELVMGDSAKEKTIRFDSVPQMSRFDSIRFDSLQARNQHKVTNIGIARGQYYWILGALFGIVLTLQEIYCPRCHFCMS